MNYQTILKRARAALSHTPNPHLEAEILLSHALKIPRSHLLAFPERLLDHQQEELISQWLSRRAAGEPMAYILQEKEFWSLTLKVNKDTLIPRPETELLVEMALQLLPASAQIVADLGTGCGAIALALAKERPLWQVIALDQSPAALQVARENATRLQLTNVDFYNGSWCDGLPDLNYHAIISNPPYIAENDPHLNEGDLRFEPQSALVAGKDGMAALRMIISQSAARLAPGGWLLLEHGHDQGQKVATCLHQAGFTAIKTYPDLAMLNRVTLGRRV